MTVDDTRFAIVGGTTWTAAIDGISGIGTSPELIRHTPRADLEIVEYGRTVDSPVVPIDPDGGPTPAVVTSVARRLLGFETTLIDAGMAETGPVPTVTVGDTPSEDIRTEVPTPSAADVFDSARTLGESFPESRLLVGETIPGGTTTALGVLRALGEDVSVSSSLPENPTELKRQVVDEALAESGMADGDAANSPLDALRYAGDPVLAAVAGVAVGALSTGTTVVLAGGTQMLAAAALVRHAGVTAPLSVATTTFIADDETTNVRAAASDLDVSLTVTCPRFDADVDHVALDRYRQGEPKEGVGMGGALALLSEANVSTAEFTDRVVETSDRLLEATDLPVDEVGTSS